MSLKGSTQRAANADRPEPEAAFCESRIFHRLREFVRD